MSQPTPTVQTLDKLDVVLKICNFLPLKDIHCLGRVNKTLNEYSKEHMYQRLLSLLSNFIKSGKFSISMRAFYRKRVKKRIPKANQRTSRAPAVASLLRWLCAEFDDTDIDVLVEDVELDIEESESESDSEEERREIRQKERRGKGKKEKEKEKKKKVTFEVPPTQKMVPAVYPQNDRIDQLAQQLEKLTLAVAQVNRAQGTSPPSNFLDAKLNETTCGMCRKRWVHMLGYKFCPKMQELLDRGVIKIGARGRP
ncbi:hypothetical protein DXG01_002487 [Tephrocybe rancida]|nr:hypothetical protein DXG01_002487 [Tephrocybe rancida]